MKLSYLMAQRKIFQTLCAAILIADDLDFFCCKATESCFWQWDAQKNECFALRRAQKSNSICDNPCGNQPIGRLEQAPNSEGCVNQAPVLRRAWNQWRRTEMSTYFERRPCKMNVNQTIHSLIYLFSKHLWHAGLLPGTMFYAMKMAVDKNQFPALIECPLSRRARPLANEYMHTWIHIR